MEILLATFIAGIACFLMPKKYVQVSAALAVLASLYAFYFSIKYFIVKKIIFAPVFSLIGGFFSASNLNLLIILFIGLFGFVISIYSVIYAREKIKYANSYYAYLLWTLCVSSAAVLTNNIAVFLFMWGAGAFLLYLLVSIQGDDESSVAGKKTIITVGGSDAVMFLGAAILWKLTGTFNMDNMHVAVVSKAAAAAFLCLLVGAMAKAGAMPFHGWIPDSSKAAPIPVIAFLPASLDKLLGIFLLVKCTAVIFVIEKGSFISLLLMLIGAGTIICAVMMALVQHNIKKLLAYHAVSQVGYMMLGIGIATPLGIAAGLFHMINHAVYKSCLFLTAGNVEYRTKETELDSLGGLAVSMPITFFACMVASLSISGIPPFNGFFSKWMIYQALIENLSSPSGRFISFFCLITAMFASALTLASFMKLLHAVFLGRPSVVIASPVGAKQSPIKEVPFTMWLPVLFLSALCIIFGVFAVGVPLKYFIYPVTGAISMQGSYASASVAVLILSGIAIGLIFYYLSGAKKTKRFDSAFTGGEELSEDNKVSGVEFYNTIKDIDIIRSIYKRSEFGAFDIYNQLKNMVLGVSRFFQYLHNGVLPTYMVWTLLGMVALFFALMR